MAWTSNGATAEFTQGRFHTVNDQHANASSITLGDEASSADQGLDETGDKWNGAVGQVASTPHSVLAPYAFSRSANGGDGVNRLPNGAYLGNSNGRSADSFDKNMSLRMAGNSSAEL